MLHRGIASSWVFEPEEVMLADPNRRFEDFFDLENHKQNDTRVVILIQHQPSVDICRPIV